MSAQIQLTNHLLEGANLASGGGEASQLTSSPLLSGASGRLWISKEGRVRLELQSEKGDTQIYYDGHTALDVRRLFQHALPLHAPGRRRKREQAMNGSGASDSERRRTAIGLGQRRPSSAHRRHHEVPERGQDRRSDRPSRKARRRLRRDTHRRGRPGRLHRARIAQGRRQPAGGAELSWDAANGVPLRAAVYSTESAAPVLELAATSISYGPVEPSVFEFTPPANAKVEEVVLPKPGEHQGDSEHGGEHEHPNVTTHGGGPGTIAVLEAKAKAGSSTTSSLPEGLQQVKINGVYASELPTELGTLLSFERSGVRYLLAGAVTPSAVEAVAKGLERDEAARDGDAPPVRHGDWSSAIRRCWRSTTST